MQKMVVKGLNMKWSAKEKIKQLHEDQRGDWLGNVAWTAIFGLGAIVIASALILAITALEGRVSSDIDKVNP